MKAALWRVALILSACQASARDIQAALPRPNPPVVSVPIYRPASGVLPAPKSIRDTPIYVYSFLDVREAEFSRKVIDAVNAGLLERLKAINSTGTLLEYRKTPRGEFIADKSALGRSSTAIPVREVVADNVEAEIMASTRLRMIIFPKSFEASGSWRFYTIRWMLFVAGNSQPFWDFSYRGEHVTFWSEKGNTEARAKKILDAAFKDLEAKGLIGTAG